MFLASTVSLARSFDFHVQKCRLLRQTRVRFSRPYLLPFHSCYSLPCFTLLLVQYDTIRKQGFSREKYSESENTKKAMEFGLKGFIGRLTDVLLWGSFRMLILSNYRNHEPKQPNRQVARHRALAEMNTAGFIVRSINCYSTKHLRVGLQENIQVPLKSCAHSKLIISN